MAEFLCVSLDCISVGGSAKGPVQSVATPQKRHLSDIGAADPPVTKLRRHEGFEQQGSAKAVSQCGVRFRVNGQEMGTLRPPSSLWNGCTELAQPHDTTAVEYTPSREQQEVIDLIVKQRKTCFITGAAGTGKSFILKHVERELLTVCSAGTVHMTAATGIAAVSIGGCTVHSFAGVGLAEGPHDMLIRRAMATTGQRWRDAECLVIDEVSMLSGEFLDLLDQVARTARSKPELPFGGLQVVLCGDFCQLGPVRPGGVREYAFEAAVWDEAVCHHICLKRVLRQKDDSFFTGLLEQLRMGQVSPIVSQALSQCTRALSIKNGVLPTKLYCTNRDVDAENAQELAKLPGEVRTLLANDQGPKSSLEALSRSCPAPKELELKVGAQVVLVKNLGPSLVNGSRGVVQAFSEGGLPVVAFHNGLLKEVPPMKWRAGDDGKTAREQIPLRLAWALTVHRCQGMTLDAAECSLAGVFAPGQAYVALSRIRSMDGLQLHSFDASKVKVSPKVAAFYSSPRFKPVQLNALPLCGEELDNHAVSG